MHEDLKNLETYQLAEMLTSYNESYRRLMSEGTKEDFEACRVVIDLIQQEIHSREQVEEKIQ